MAVSFFSNNFKTCISIWSRTLADEPKIHLNFILITLSLSNHLVTSKEGRL